MPKSARTQAKVLVLEESFCPPSLASCTPPPLTTVHQHPCRAALTDIPTHTKSLGRFFTEFCGDTCYFIDGTSMVTEQRIDSSYAYIVKSVNADDNGLREFVSNLDIRHIGTAFAIPLTMCVMTKSRIFLVWKWGGISLGALTASDFSHFLPSSHFHETLLNFIRRVVVVLHRHNIIYGDWSARNITYDSLTDRFRLIDFGRMVYITNDETCGDITKETPLEEIIDTAVRDVFDSLSPLLVKDNN